MTPPRGLADIFRRLIATTGPISLAHYMAEANARYYTSADPLGDHVGFLLEPLEVHHGEARDMLTFEQVKGLTPGHPA